MKKLFLCLCLFDFAFALQTQTLSKVTATAQKESQKEVEFANKTSISADDIQKHQATNLRDIFSQDPSINVGGGNPTAQKIYVRGLEDRLFNVNIDGATQGGNIFHHQGNVNIDPMMLKSVDVQKDSADASAGPGALAGAISMTTKDATDLLKSGQKVGAQIGLGGFSNAGYRLKGSIYGSLNDYVNALLYLNQTNISYYRDGNNQKVIGSQSDQNSLLLKVNGNLRENQKYFISFTRLYDKTTAPFATNLSSRELSLFDHYNDTKNLSVGYELSGQKGLHPNIKTNFYYSTRGLILKSLSILDPADDAEVADRNIDLQNFGGNVLFSHSFGKNMDNTFEYGLNYQGMYVRDKDISKDAIDMGDRGRESSNILGGFFQVKYYLLPSLIWGVGSRYDVYYYQDKNSQNHLTQGFSPNTSLNYSPIDTLNLRLSYAYNTRGAQPGDATLLQEGNVRIDKNLKAENSQNVEFDLDYMGDYLSFRGAVYYKNIGNFINSYAPSPLVADGGLRSNMSDKIDVYGYEGGIGFDYKGFTSYFSLAQSFPMVKNHLLQDTYELGAVYGRVYNIRLGYNFDSIHLSLGWLTSITEAIRYNGWDIYNNELAEVHKKGYVIDNLYINWDPFGKDKLHLGLSILNLTNKFYIDQTSPFKNEADDKLTSSNIGAAMPNPGIDVRFEVGYMF